MDDLRLLIREMVKQLMQDDALFKHSDPPGILDKFDMPGDSQGGDTHSRRSYMARPQLYNISKNASEILDMLEDEENISDWMESHIAQADQMIDAVHEKLSFKKSGNY